MRRGTVAFAAVAVAGTLLAGCGSGPSQVGAAAIVGDTAVSLDHVQDWFARVVDDRELREQIRANGQLDDLGRLIATEAVRHELLRWVASQERLDYNEAQVTGLIDQLGGPAAVAEETLYDADTIRDRARDQLIALELGRKYFETTAVTFDVTSAQSRSAASAAAEELAAADDEAAKAIIDRDIQNGMQAQADQQLWMSEDSQAAAQIPLFAAADGDVIAFQVGDATGVWWIAKVHEVSIDERRSESPSALTADRVDPRLMEQIGRQLLARLTSDVDVKLNPRYGVWDPVYLEAVPSEGETRAFVVSGAPAAD